MVTHSRVGGHTMGLIGLLFRKKGPEVAERIWSTTARKMDDLAAQVQSSHERGVYPVTVVHFKATQKLVLGAFREKGITFQVISSSSKFPTRLTDELRQDATTLLIPSDVIPTFVARGQYTEAKDNPLPPTSVHVAEHYPLPARDQHVLSLDKTWRMPIEFICYTALDEPWLRLFGVERVLPLLANLGMSEDTCLSHPQLTRSIQAAQKKIARQVRQEQSCDSCEEWIQKNLPQHP